uniref:Uncharacterized protein n=1 Tax=Noctiluca scintillans TaxID=2966 RepID=A0A7S1F7N8_NOCSC|mmetsp:Transcript_41166/g.108949  ORF Transcript_41166/g.108949 Transcript_41166/m.108949 type:complete len:280 (+) Transcript_41166:133-972(+)
MQRARNTAGQSARESKSTRNPHVAKKPATVKVGSRLNSEERVLEQWRAASGCSISDEAKTLFCVHALGDSFQLGDVRLWYDQHAGKQSSTIFLEFFFDGAPDDIKEDAGLFTKVFETMIEDTLRERRVTEFRRRARARRRGGGTRARSAAAVEEDFDGGEGGGFQDDSMSEADDDWRRYLQSTAPATDLSVKSIREAGCTLRFLVCQTSLSISAAEELGQMALPEHFPIDGIAQVIPVSDKPPPRWFYALACTSCAMSLIALCAWWQVVKGVILPVAGV